MRLILHDIAKLQSKDNEPTCNKKKNLTCDVATTESFLNLYKYESPMEKQLNKVQSSIAEKENDIKKLKHEIDKIESVGKDNSSHLDLGPMCSRCHQHLKHKSSKCQHEPCSSWLQHGRTALHKSEKKQFESKKGNLKKFLCNLHTLESEAKRLKEVMDSKVRSFSNVIKPHLIRSNPSKYLTSLNGTILPVTRTINIDLAIIKEHYNS